MQLENAGYRAVSQVMEHGEYATLLIILFDLYPMGSTTLPLFGSHFLTMR
ncbi:hypothetical protein PT276_06850 [Orbaceae bacterium ESL0721]|nr:hypothetical protein [Orbaceae bacterium ESL0721]